MIRGKLEWEPKNPREKRISSREQSEVLYAAENSNKKSPEKYG